MLHSDQDTKTKWHDKAIQNPMYHGTSDAKLELIIQHGLQTSKHTHPSKRPRKIPGVFLTNDFLFAARYALRAQKFIGGNAVVLEVDISRIDDEHFHPDAEYIRSDFDLDDDGFDYEESVVAVCDVGIEPSRIKNIYWIGQDRHILRTAPMPKS